MTIARRRKRAPQRSRGFDLERGHPQRRWLAGCAGKAKYSSEAAALAGLGLQLGDPSMEAYRCPHCDGWHLASVRPSGGKRDLARVHVMTFVCGRCLRQHPAIATSADPWTPERRRVALLQLEPIAIGDGWSVGADEDHCPICAAALGLETTRRPAA